MAKKNLLIVEIMRERQTILEIAERHGAHNVRLFGSVVRGDERPDSDVDILVDFAENRGFTDYLALAEELEGFIGRSVDLVTERGLSPHFRPYIVAEAKTL